MPKLPVVSGRQLIDVLRSLGFEVDRQRGSHVVLRRGSTICVVPLHRELRRGTLTGILEQAGVSRETLVAAL